KGKAPIRWGMQHLGGGQEQVDAWLTYPNCGLALDIVERSGTNEDGPGSARAPDRNGTVCHRYSSRRLVGPLLKLLFEPKPIGVLAQQPVECRAVVCRIHRNPPPQS